MARVRLLDTGVPDGEMDAGNPLGAKPGQRVLVEVCESGMLRSALVIVLLPLLAMLACGYAGDLIARRQGWDELAMTIAGCAFGVACAVLYAGFFDRRSLRGGNRRPVITRVGPGAEGAGEGTPVAVPAQRG